MKNLKNNFPIHPTPKGGGLSWEFSRKMFNNITDLKKFLHEATIKK